MEPRKQNMTQKATHVAQGEGKSVWFADELLTFKVDRDQSESVGIFEDEVPPQSGAPQRSRGQTVARVRRARSYGEAPGWQRFLRWRPLLRSGYALYAYTHVADEGGLDLNGFPAVLAWLERVSSQPGYIPITRG
jgi:hypothetical protein